MTLAGARTREALFQEQAGSLPKNATVELDLVASVDPR